MNSIIILLLFAITAFFGVSLKLGSNPYQDPLKDSITRGEDLYIIHCLNCHLENGEGLPGLYPPVAGSDHMKTDAISMIEIMLQGQFEEYTVNGVNYNMFMDSYAYLSDQEIADVLNYIGNNWGNKHEVVTVQQVEAQRNGTP